MLIILKSDTEFLFITNSITTGEWRKNVVEIPENVIAVLEDNDPLAKKITESQFFEPVFDPTKTIYDEGYLKDITIIDPPVTELTLQEQVGELVNKLNLTDYKVIKNAEVLLPALAKLVSIDLPYDPVETHEERQSWRDKIGELSEATK